MFMRAACIVLVVSLGLSACAAPRLSRPGEDVLPTTILDVSQGTGISRTHIFPTAQEAAPTETSKATDIVQIQSVPATSQAVESSGPSSTEAFPYRLQVGTPRAMTNFIQPAAGCNWMGVGGQAFDLRGQPVSSLVVEVGGTLAGADVFHLELTGNETDLGPGGYLIVLSNRPIASIGSMWILLYDLDGQPLSNKIYFSTSQDCASNLILINFVEVNPNFAPRVYFPIIY